jgi:hypothetical protein
MREYTVEELAQLSLDELYDIKQVKIGELAAAQNKGAVVINEIMVMQRQIQQVGEDTCQ